MRFAEEGAKIFAVDRNPELDPPRPSTRSKPSAAKTSRRQCDVTDSASVAAMVKACIIGFGRIDAAG